MNSSGKKTELFSFLAFTWNVSAAQALVANYPPAKDSHVINVDAWMKLTGFIRIDKDYALTDAVDLTDPVILAPIVDSDGEDAGTVLIDGWHRLYKAYHQGITRLPAIILTKEDEWAVRIRGGNK